MRETIRLTHGPFFVSGPDVEYIVETWRCGCRDWPIVVQSITYTNDPEAWPKREGWFVRPCRLCKMEPRPNGS